MIAGAGAAAPASEACDPAEPAANVGAVDGALRPPSDDAMVARGEAQEDWNNHQATALRLIT